MKSFVTGLLEEKLSPYYYYHNVDHTLYVMDRAIEIGQYENCSERETVLLSAAALWHDAGFINTYHRHEEESCLLARTHLPQYGYTDDDINAVCGMIMATQIPQTPKNILEAVIADADLEYLGTGNVVSGAENLFRELQYLHPSLTKAAWNDTQISFLHTHRYFTRFCKEKRELLKQQYLWSLVNNIDKRG